MKNWEYILDLLGLKPTKGFYDGNYGFIIKTLLSNTQCMFTTPDCCICPVDKICNKIVMNWRNDQPSFTVEDERELYEFLQEDCKQ